MERISSFFFAFFLFGKLVWMWIILCRQIAETQAKKLLTNPHPHAIIPRKLRGSPHRGVEQLEARRAHNPEVVGSSPASATIKTPGIRDECRDFSDFLTLFEMAQLAVLGHLGQKSVFLGHTVRVSGGIFYAFFRSSTSAIHAEALALFSSMMWA